MVLYPNFSTLIYLIYHNFLLKWTSDRITFKLAFKNECLLESIKSNLTRSIQDSKTSIDFVQGPPGSHREQAKYFNHCKHVRFEISPKSEMAPP